MKSLITIIALLNCLVIYSQEYNLNPDVTKIEWIGYGEVGGFKQEGTINVKEGSVMMKEGRIEYAEIVIDMKSISHPDKSLSKHLRKKDFFWSKKYPVAKLTFLEIINDTIIANLKIRDIIHEVRFPFQIEENDKTIVIRGALTIDRTKYNIKYNSSSYFQDLGNYAIKNEFDINFEATFGR